MLSGDYLCAPRGKLRQKPSRKCSDDQTSDDSANNAAVLALYLPYVRDSVSRIVTGQKRTILVAIFRFHNFAIHQSYSIHT